MARYLAAAEARSTAVDQVATEVGEGGGSKALDGRDGNGKLNGGARAAGAEGKLGTALSRPGDKGRYALAKASPEPAALTRDEALADARSFGISGVLAGEGPHMPFASFGELAANGPDPFSAMGDLRGNAIGETFGSGGLALSGTGEGGGGLAAGIGLGQFIGIGHGRGIGGLFGTGGGGGLPRTSRGWGSGSYLSYHYPRCGYALCPRKRFRLRYGATLVGPMSIVDAAAGDADLTSDAVGRAVRSRGTALLDCPRSRTNSDKGELEPVEGNTGTIVTRFLIGPTGSVLAASIGSTSVLDPTVVVCVTSTLKGLSFPARPGGGVVPVLATISFSWPY